MNTNLPLEEYLLASGVVSELQINYALQKKKVTNEYLGEILIRLGVVSETAVAHALAKHHGIMYQSPGLMQLPDPEVLALFGHDICRRQAFLPLRRNGHYIEAMVGNANLSLVRKTIRRSCGLELIAVQVEFTAVLDDIRDAFRNENAQLEDLLDKEITKLSADTDQVLSNDDLLSCILLMAVSERATDVHLQPDHKSIHVNFRIDSLLHPILALEKKFRRLLLSIKVRSNMDISDNLRPQDGRFSIQLRQMQYDIRVSTTITRFGENMVMRLLPSGAQVKSFMELGFLEEDLDKLNYFFAQPHGIVLFAGPTGSGKTTSMFAGIKKQTLSGKNILSIEDPIEYEMPVIVQTQVNRKADFMFDKAIIHFLRHDPDVILVGEIRDAETAKAAIQASETGHLVLSTLHANSAYGALPRLNGLGVSSRIIAGALIGVINQRLVRALCTYCKQVDRADITIPKWLVDTQDITFYKGQGCNHCRWSGYHGRLPIYEILLVDKPFADAISRDCTLNELSIAAQDCGYVAMEDVAKKRLIRGETTVAELVRVIGMGGAWR